MVKKKMWTDQVIYPATLGEIKACSNLLDSKDYIPLYSMRWYSDTKGLVRVRSLLHLDRYTDSLLFDVLDTWRISAERGDIFMFHPVLKEPMPGFAGLQLIVWTAYANFGSKLPRERTPDDVHN